MQGGARGAGTHRGLVGGILKPCVAAPHQRANAPPAAAEAAGKDVGPFSAARTPVSGRPLKKVQMQGGAGCEARGVPRVYVAAPRERANAADGPFSAAC